MSDALIAALGIVVGVILFVGAILYFGLLAGFFAGAISGLRAARGPNLLVAVPLVAWFVTVIVLFGVLPVIAGAWVANATEIVAVLGRVAGYCVWPAILGFPLCFWLGGFVDRRRDRADRGTAASPGALAVARDAQATPSDDGTTMTIEEHDAALTLNATEDGSGDYLVAIEVRADGFVGRTDGHVTGDDWRAFVQRLAALEASRKGAARLVSARDGEFAVKVEAIDERGHMGASGTLSHRRAGRESSSLQRLEFALEFDPSQLAPFARAVASASGTACLGARSARA